MAVISDYKLMAEYKAEFLACAMDVEMFPLDWARTFPPLRILLARAKLFEGVAPVIHP